MLLSDQFLISLFIALTGYRDRQIEISGTSKLKDRASI